MFKLDSGSNKDDKLNSSVKSHLDKKKLSNIRKELLYLAEIDIKSSKSYNIIVIKKDENENRMAKPTIIPQRNYREDSEIIKQNKIKIKNVVKIDNVIDSDPSELANSSDFDYESDE